MKKSSVVNVVFVAVAVVVFRLLCALFLRTSFVPDEYWQANEVSIRPPYPTAVLPPSLLAWSLDMQFDNSTLAFWVN